MPEVVSTSGSEAEATDSSATIPGCSSPPYAGKLRGSLRQQHAEMMDLLQGLGSMPISPSESSEFNLRHVGTPEQLDPLVSALGDNTYRQRAYDRLPKRNNKLNANNSHNPNDEAGPSTQP
ncbi:hypothetical protein SprV_0200922000 [Sparganum proliferum]